MAVLKKSQILQGINDPRKMKVKTLGDDGELWLRPLSNSELDEIDAIEAKMMESYETNERTKVRGRTIQQGETTSRGKLNMVKAAKFKAEARDLMIYKSLDNEKNADDPWDLSDVGKLRREVAEELVEIIQELSGVGVEKSDIDSFPED